MKKIISLIIIGCLVLMVVGGILLGVGLANGGKLTWGINYSSKGFAQVSDVMVDGEYEIQDAIRKIETETGSINVNILPGEQAKVIYHCYEGHVPEIKAENGKLSVKETEFIGMDFSINMTTVEQEYVNIYLPKEMIYEADLEVASGEITVEDLDMYGKVKVTSGNVCVKNSKSEGQWNFKVSSGDVTVDRITADSINVAITSGNYKLSNTNVNLMNLEAASGAITISDINSGEVICKATSGTLKVSNVTTGLFTSTIGSGSVKVTGLTADKIDCSASSGTTTVEINGKEEEYGYSMSASSGNISCGSHKGEGSKNMDYEKRITGEITSGNMKFIFTE